MGNLNKVMLIGFLGQDPEKRVTSGGHSVVTVNLATTDRFNDKQGNRQERTEWHRLVFWNQRADFVEQYCRKGTQLYVEGSLQTREWQDRDGNKRYTTEIVVRNSQILDRLPPGQRDSASGQPGYQAAPQDAAATRDATPQPMQQQFQEPPAKPTQTQGNAETDDFIEDDIPF